MEEAAQITPKVRAQFPTGQIQCLDTVGAFIQLCNSAVANQLFHAPLFDKAVPAHGLHTKICSLRGTIGQIGFQNWRHQLNQIIGILPHLRIWVLHAFVQRH